MKQKNLPWRVIRRRPSSEISFVSSDAAWRVRAAEILLVDTTALCHDDLLEPRLRRRGSSCGTAIGATVRRSADHRSVDARGRVRIVLVEGLVLEERVRTRVALAAIIRRHRTTHVCDSSTTRRTSSSTSCLRDGDTAAHGRNGQRRHGGAPRRADRRANPPAKDNMTAFA